MSLASIAAPNVSSLSTLRNTPSKRERLRNRALRRDKAPDSTASGDTSGTVPTPEVPSLRPVGSPSDHVDSQRKHISTPPPQIGSSLIQSTTTNKPTPSSDNILKWTLTEEAIAPCFIKDVMGMREHTTKDPDFFWLGRVPCRITCLVGMLVGLEVYEKKTMYTLDDGTGIIECLEKNIPLPKSTSPHERGAGTRPVSSRYEPFISRKAAPEVVASLMNPPVSIGDLVKLQGRVITWHNTRRIYVNKIERCKSLNDEVSHWNHVLGLHRTYYSGDTPFVIPPLSAPVRTAPVSPFKPPQTPTSKSVAAHDPKFSSSTYASSLRGETPSSPSKSALEEESLPHIRLRHPTKTVVEELTDHTFRLHLKHYMDYSPSYLLEANSASAPSLETPKNRLEYDHATPRPSLLERSGLQQKEILGFTLSHLRRVPELALLAGRVVRAEARRRLKQAESQKGAGRSTQYTSTRSSSSALPGSSESSAKKEKRLFTSTLVKLHKEGLIILSEGSSWPMQTSELTQGQISTTLWSRPARRKGEGDSSTASASSRSTTSFSSTSMLTSTSSASMTKSEDMGHVSDPQEGELCYISLTPAVLGDVVTKAIGTLVDQDRQKARTTRPGLVNAKGATVGTITTFLRRSDERWMHLGEWAVEDTLRDLVSKGEIWDVGEGKWELCL